MYTQACFTYTKWHGRHTISPLKRHDWCIGASHCFSTILSFERCFLIQKLYQETGDICWYSKLAWFRFSGQSGQTGQTSHINRSDRSIKVCQIVNWTAPLRRSRWDDQNAYMEHLIWSPNEKVMPPWRPAPETIKMHIWNIQFRVQMRKLCLLEDLHPGLTGQTGPVVVRPV